MTEALIDYGLFAAKTMTLIGFIGLVLLALMRASRSGVSEAEDDTGHLEVIDLNDRLDHMADAIRHASLPHKAYKKARRAHRKAERMRAKAQVGTRRRLFVIDFKGDILASEVSGLREAISAVLLDKRADDEVFVRLENAGGAVHEHGLAASQLLRLRARGIPLTVAVDRVAASGGYLMACVADRILAAPFALIGSIGVLAELPNFHRLLERNGIDFELHTAGDYKRTLTLFGENTDDGRAKLRQQLEETHGQFKDFILRHRAHLDLDQVATGEYWHGEQALALGLVDEIGTSDDYLVAASAEADIYRVRLKVKKRPMQRLLASLRLAAANLAARVLAR